MRLPTLPLILAATMLAADARAQTTTRSPWVGQRVITRYGTVLNNPRVGLDDEDRSRDLAVSGHVRRRFRIYKVDFVNGRWLWLVPEGEGMEGWVDASWVVPFDQAIDYCTAHIHVKPDSAAAYIDRAVIWKEKGEFAIAIADLNEAIRLDPRDEAAYLNRGTIWNAEKEYAKAITDYDEAIRLDPKFAMAYNDRGVVWYAEKKHAKAIADYDEAIRLAPKFAVAYLNRGLVWTAEREYIKAITDYDEAIRLDPKYALAHLGRGVTWTAEREYAKAIADYDEAIRLDPKYADAYNYRAWLRATCPEARYRNGAAAVKDANKACELNGWKIATDFGNLAVAYAEMGNFAKAIEKQEKALNLYKEGDPIDFGRKLLDLYKAGKPYHEGEESP